MTDALQVAQQDTGNAGGGFNDPGAGTQTPAPAPGPSPQATTQSAPQDAVPRPPVDPRAYAFLDQFRPEDRARVDARAKETGADPFDMAAVWNNESHGAHVAPRGRSGEVSATQVLPNNWKEYSRNENRDPGNIDDALTITGRMLHDLYGQFGKGTPSVLGAYQSGAATIDGIVNQLKNGAPLDQLEKAHPNLVAYLHNAYGPNVGLKDLTPSHTMTPQGVMAASSQGPDGFLQYVAANKAPGSGMTDAWRQAENSLVKAMALRGDYNGIAHAHDMIFQMSHVGTNQYLMAAHQAMESGDTNGAAQALAKAHAFFPDESMGRFSVNHDGTLWGERLDEHNPGKVIGRPFQITSEGIASMLNQTSDPQQYLKMMQEQQKNNAYIRHADAYGQAYAEMIHQKPQLQEMKDETTLQAARERGEVAAAIHEQGRRGIGPTAGLSAAVDKETAGLYNDVTMSGATPEQRGTMGETYHELRTMGGVSGPQAQNVTDGLATGRLELKGPASDGSYGVVNPKQPGPPIAYLSKNLVARLYPKALQAGPAGPQPGAPNNPAPNTVVGQGAPSAVARASGIGQNMTGYTTPPPPGQSAAIPPPR